MSIVCECEVCKTVRAMSDAELKAELKAELNMLINELSRREQKVLYIIEITDKKPEGVPLQ